MRRILLRWPILAALVMLPVVSLFLVQGVLSLFAGGIHIASLVVAASVLLVLLGTAVWFFRAIRRPGTPVEDVVDMVAADPAWGQQQQQVWNETCRHVEDLLAENDEPEAMFPHSMSVLRKVAFAWNPSGRHLEYAVSLPEALLAVETLASRYRLILIERVPFANRVKMSRVLSLRDLYETHGKKLRFSFQAYRVYRSFSVAGLFGELGSLLLGGASDHARETLLYNLKRAYLQEVASVAIDLYSGSFSRRLDELPVAQAVQGDLDRLAEQVGPIRILLVGQVSSGKSTLVNTLLGELRAEAGLVPTTQSEAVYQFAISEGLDTHIIDTPGVDSDDASRKQALGRLMNADLVVWVMRANQPARSIDHQLYAAFEQRLNASPERQRPGVLVVATHIDRIPAFAQAREENLLEVTAPLADVCRKSVAYDAFCPVSLKEPALGVAAFRQTLSVLYERAINTRLNRIRVSKPSLYETSSEELRRLGTGTLAVFRLLRSDSGTQGK